MVRRACFDGVYRDPPKVEIERAVTAMLDRFGYIARRAVAVLVVTGVIQNDSFTPTLVDVSEHARTDVDRENIAGGVDAVVGC